MANENFYIKLVHIWTTENWEHFTIFFLLLLIDKYNSSVRSVESKQEPSFPPITLEDVGCGQCNTMLMLTSKVYLKCPELRVQGCQQARYWFCVR